MKNFYISVLLFLILLTHFNNGSNFVEKCLDCVPMLFNSEPKINPSHLECVADFLLLKKENVRTEIFAEKEKGTGEDWIVNLFEPKWKIGRRIVLNQADVWGKHGDNHHKNDMDVWRIYETKMTELLGQPRTRKCFANLREYVEWYRDNGKKQRMLSMSKILMDYNSLYLNLSNAFALKLDSMQSCLLGFLAKYKSLENIQHEAAPENIRSAENAIKDNFKMVYQLKTVVFRWEVKESDKESLKYKPKTNEFADLEKCQTKLFEKKYISNNDIMDANKILEYFNAKQLYLRDYPYYMENYTIGKLPANTVIDNCSVCLGDSEDSGNFQRVFPCKHTFHAGCIQKWLVEKNTCPICRGMIKINLNQMEPAPEVAHIQTQNAMNAYVTAMMNMAK